MLYCSWVVLAKHQRPKLELYTEMGGITATQTWSSHFLVCFLSCRHNQLSDTEACTYCVWAIKPVWVTSARLVLASVQGAAWVDLSHSQRQLTGPRAATNQIQLQPWEWEKGGGRGERGGMLLSIHRWSTAKEWLQTAFRWICSALQKSSIGASHSKLWRMQITSLINGLRSDSAF